MERPTPLILPEGFVRNTDEIYQEVASYPVVPPEKLWQYWHVYTTTFRRLIDPTASRLENFWWHVLGSDRRYLSGKALAKIYEEISTGPSFAPLRGPPNRFHTPLPRITQQEVDRASYGTNAQPGTKQGPQENPDKPAPEKTTAKDPLSSSSRPPPPHPILKKSRGPSASGPRPTARFVSPHDSEEEAPKDVDTSSGSTGAAGLEMRRPPAAAPAKTERKSTPTGRKFTVSTAASKRRPVMGRRQSSQSSVLSETSTKVSTSDSGSRASAGSRQGSAEQQTTTASLASSGHSTLVSSPGLSAKAAGKRPLRATPDTSGNLVRGSLPSAQARAAPIIVQQQESHGPVKEGSERSRNKPASDFKPSPVKAPALLSTPSAGAGAIVGAQATAPVMARSQSNIEHQQFRPREPTLVRALPQSFITPKSVAVTKKAADVAVQVQFDSDNVTAQSGGIARDVPDSIAIASRPSTSSLYAPTQPSPTPDIPLGRSKSQLTLLLERDKDRAGDLLGRSKSARGERDRGKGS